MADMIPILLVSHQGLYQFFAMNSRLNAVWDFPQVMKLLRPTASIAHDLPVLESVSTSGTSIAALTDPMGSGISFATPSSSLPAVAPNVARAGSYTSVYMRACMRLSSVLRACACESHTYAYIHIIIHFDLLSSCVYLHGPMTLCSLAMVMCDGLVQL